MSHELSLLFESYSKFVYGLPMAVDPLIYSVLFIFSVLLIYSA